MTPKQAGWMGDSMRRVRNAAQRLRDRAAADERPAAPPILPSADRESWDEACCKTCSRRLRRTDNPARECYQCETNPGPLTAAPRETITYGCGCK